MRWGYEVWGLEGVPECSLVSLRMKLLQSENRKLLFKLTILFKLYLFKLTFVQANVPIKGFFSSINGIMLRLTKNRHRIG